MTRFADRDFQCDVYSGDHDRPYERRSVHLRVLNCSCIELFTSLSTYRPVFIGDEILMSKKHQYIALICDT